MTKCPTVAISQDRPPTRSRAPNRAAPTIKPAPSVNPAATVRDTANRPVTVNQPDDILVELWATKAVILDKLGRKEEAAQMRKRSAEPAKPDAPSVYKLFHERLKNWRVSNKKETVKP